MLTSALEILVKDIKTKIFTLKIVLFILLKGQLHKFQNYFTIFGSLTSASETLVNIFLKTN
jgi:hypothetical protein